MLDALGDQVYADGHSHGCGSGEERQAQNRLRDDHPATLYPNFPLEPGEAWRFDCSLLQVCNTWTPYGHPVDTTWTPYGHKMDTCGESVETLRATACAGVAL